MKQLLLIILLLSAIMAMSSCTAHIINTSPSALPEAQVIEIRQGLTQENLIRTEALLKIPMHDPRRRKGWSDDYYLQWFLVADTVKAGQRFVLTGLVPAKVDSSKALNGF